MIIERRSTTQENGRRHYPLQDLISEFGKAIHRETNGEIPDFSDAIKILAKVGMEEGWWDEEEIFKALPDLDPGPKVIAAGDYKYDENIGNFIETPHGRVYLTPYELLIMIDLLSHDRNIRSFEQLARSRGFTDKDFDTLDLDYHATIRTHMVSLRKKLKDVKGPDGNYQLIQGVKYKGYRFCSKAKISTLSQS
jgi:DNA-binding response OmpR family regulator